MYIPSFNFDRIVMGQKTHSKQVKYKKSHLDFVVIALGELVLNYNGDRVVPRVLYIHILRYIFA